MERRTDAVVVGGTRGQTVVDARTSLALWLRAARGERGMTLDDVAKITKIQPRILERLEAGKAEGLPADVFVRGFIRSFAKSVGLDEGEALRRYSACTGGTTPAPVVSASTSVTPVSAIAEAPRARAVVAAMSDLAPNTAAAQAAHRAPVEIIHVAEPIQLAAGSAVGMPTIEDVIADASASVVEVPAEPVVAEAVVTADADDAATSTSGKKKRKTKGPAKPRGKRGVARSMATGTPAEPTPVVTEPAPIAVSEIPRPVYRPDPTVDAFATPVASAALADELTPADPTLALDASTTSSGDGSVDVNLEEPAAMRAADLDDEPAVASAPWQPTMPPAPAPSAAPAWRRSFFAAPVSSTSTARGKAVVPSLVIDDADPDSAERELEERAAVHHETRRSFLPPILLDREDRSARQGGLTLAVIILLIAATLTLSYLMRRPSSSGDGVTSAAVPAQLIG